MPGTMKQYPAKTHLTRSASESAVNALFVKNVYARNSRRKVRTRQRKKSAETSIIPELPPIDENHELLNDTDSSFHVIKLDNTFDRLKQANDPFDQLFCSKTRQNGKQPETKTNGKIITKDTDKIAQETLNDSETNSGNSNDSSTSSSKNEQDESLSYSTVFNSESLHLGSSKRKKSPETIFTVDASVIDPSLDSLDITVAKIKRNAQNLGKAIVCSTPITKNKKLKALHVLSPVKLHDSASHEIIGESVQQVYNWSYRSPEVSAYNTVVPKRRHNTRRYAINGYKNESGSNLSVLERTKTENSHDLSLQRVQKSRIDKDCVKTPPPSFVALKFASNQSPPKLSPVMADSVVDFFHAESPEMPSLENEKTLELQNRCKYVYVIVERIPEQQIIDILRKQSESFESSSDATENSASVSSEEASKTEISKDITLDSIDQEYFDEFCAKNAPIVARSLQVETIVEQNEFEEFFTSMIDSVQKLYESCADIDENDASEDEFKENDASEDEFKENDASEDEFKEKFELTNHVNENKRNSAKKLEQIDDFHAEYIDNDANTNKQQEENENSSESEDNASTYSNAGIRQSLKRVSQYVTKRRHLPRKVKRPSQYIQSPDLFSTLEEESDLDLRVSSDDTEQVEESNEIKKENEEMLKKETEIEQNQKGLTENKEETNISVNQNGCKPEMVNINENSMNESKNSVEIIELEDEVGDFVMPEVRKTMFKPKPGKSWRRSLSMIKRNTLCASILEGAQGLNGAVSNDSSVGRRTIFTLSSDPPNNKRRTTKNFEYEQNRLRETAALENLIENISLINVSHLELSNHRRHNSNTNSNDRNRPTARQLVLQRCKQGAPIKFSKWYPDSTLRNCHKIGEGVYGEVFLYRNAVATEGSATVMKVIPIEGEMLVNGERQKQFDEILSEIVIASELSNIRYGTRNQTTGFNQLKNVRCVKGKYPERLVELWELYAENKGTENDNPQMFEDNQLYIVLELANAGNDLESFVFTNFNEVYHVFLQIVLSLAVAEEELQFEHRDLHWGNVLINRVSKDTQCKYKLRGESITVPASSVEANIIDFTLSRITYDKISFYNDLSQDPDLFNAEGDYQFEIYKLMQIANRNNWEPFQPKTNIFWLHYILVKMTSSVHLMRKTVTGRNKTRFHQLVDWENTILQYKSAKHFVEEVILPHLRQK